MKRTRGAGAAVNPGDAKDMLKQEVDYDALRNENIKKNEEFLRTLGLQGIKSHLESSAVKRDARQHSSAAARRPVPAAPQRRSSRVTAERLKVEIQEAIAAGNNELSEQKSLELQQKMESQAQGSYEALIEAEVEHRIRNTEEELPLSDVCYNKVVETENQLTNLRNLFSFHKLDDSSSPKKKKKRAGITATPAGERVVYNGSYESPMDCTDVGKLTANRITQVLFHPSTEKLIVTAGDKSGNIGIWDLTKRDAEEDNIYLYTPHVSNICGLFYPPSCPNRLYTTSYDRTLRYLDVEKASFTLGFLAPEDADEMFYTDAAFLGSGNLGVHTTGEVAYIARSDGQVAGVDMRASSRSYSWKFQAQDVKLNVIQIHPMNDNVIICAGGTAISIHDIRYTGKGSSRQKTLIYENALAHSKSICAASVSPDGSCLVSLSHDDTMKLWEGDVINKVCGKSSETPMVCSQILRKNNHTGRWLSTFRHVFDPKLPRTLIVGSMDQPRRLEVYALNDSKDNKSIGHVSSLMSEDLKSVCSRNAIHPGLHVIAGGNSSGRVHIFR